jgi:hypothetical protein
MPMKGKMYLFESYYIPILVYEHEHGPMQISVD